jgi:hypothetical protein
MTPVGRGLVPPTPGGERSVADIVILIRATRPSTAV